MNTDFEQSKQHRSGHKPDGRSWLDRNRSDLRFVLVFFSCVITYYLLVLTPPIRDGFFPAYLKLNAQVSGQLLNYMGQEVHVNDKVISLARPDKASGSIEIERGCDAVEPSALFLAAVFASPVFFRAKLLAALWGVSALMLLNLVRIVSLFLVRVHYPEMFEVMHLDVWQVVFIFFALFLWGKWASKMAQRMAKQNHVPA